MGSDALKNDLDVSVRLTHSPYHRWRLHVLDAPSGSRTEEREASPADALAFLETFCPDLAAAALQCIGEDGARAERALVDRKERAAEEAAMAVESIVELERAAAARRAEREAIGREAPDG